MVKLIKKVYGLKDASKMGRSFVERPSPVYGLIVNELLPLRLLLMLTLPIGEREETRKSPTSWPACHMASIV
jgi:hypothetical protein